METEIDEVEINGTKYVPKDVASKAQAFDLDGLEYVIVRGDRSGVFAGYLEEQSKELTVLRN